MTWLLHRYRPFTVAALIDLAKQDIAQRRFAAYAADMVWLVAGRLSRGRFEIKAPSQYAAELDDGNRPERRDSRTARQILGDLKERLLSSGNKRT